MRGMGRIFERKGSPYLWVAYRHRGKEIRESAKTDDRNKAEKFLKDRLDEVGADRLGSRPFVGPRADRVKMGELLDALTEDYRARGKESSTFKSHVKGVREYFSDMKAVLVTKRVIDLFISDCREAGQSPATINHK